MPLLKAKKVGVDRHMTEVPLSANAYVTKRGKSANETIGSDGLHNWTSDETIISVYFYAKIAVKMDVSITCKVLPSGESTLQLSLEGTSHEVKVTGTQYQTFQVGSFEVKSRGYHKIDLKGVHKTGSYFADVSHLVIGDNESQASIEAITKSPDRGTPSVHLWFKTPNEKIEYYYNEVNVVKGNEPVGTYYMAVGFNVGYFGIQVNSETERRILFSIWSPQNEEDPHKITEENKVKLVSKGKNTIVEDFGNEGSGGHAFIKHMWKSDTTYKFLVKALPDANNKTIYTAWIALEDGLWELVASFARPKTQQYLTGYYSFLEDFNPDTGYLPRKARYGNQWVCDTTGNWTESTQATFTGNVSARQRIRFDFEGGVETYENHEYFFLRNGGFFEGNTKMDSILNRKANKVKPNIDLSKLPSS